MRSSRHVIFTIIAILLFSSITLAANCPPEGDGGDVILNRLKNRYDSATHPNNYQEMTVKDFLHNFTPTLHTRKFRKDFTDEQNTYIEPKEGLGFSLVGYILGAKKSGPESCNCHEADRLDFHVWVGADKPASKEDAKVKRAESIVVEPTPAGQQEHTGWTVKKLNELSSTGTMVRISGWAMYDPEHPPELGKTRGSLWEIHPVTKIEYLEDGEWKEL